MTQAVRSQLQKLVRENSVKTDARPRPIQTFSCNVRTEREIEAQRGEKIIKEKLNISYK